MRPAVLRISTVLLLAGPTALAFFSGGFFDESRLVAALAVWALVVVAAVAAPRPLPVSGAGRAAVAALVALAALTLLSMAWAPLAGPAWHDAQRLALYAGALIAACALLRDRAAAEAVEPALVAGALLIALYGLSERLLPGVVDLTNSFSAQGRLEQPLTYWNAEGSVLAVGLVLALRLAGSWRRPAALRVAAAAAVPWLAAGVYLTLSRGALAAVGTGVLVLLVASPSKPQLRAVGLGLAGGLVAAVAAGLLDGVESLEGGGSEAQGAAMLGLLLVLCGVSALVTRRLTRAEVASPLRRDRYGRPRGAAALALVLAAALGVMVAMTGSSERPALDPDEPRAGAERLRSVGSNRYEYWDVALGAFADGPLVGGGSGSFRVAWLRERTVAETVQDAHSLTLETAAELGVAGLALLGVLVGAVALAARWAVRAAPLLGPGAAAGLAAWLLHAQLDWLWEMPAATLNALLLAALAITLCEERRPRRTAAAARRPG